MLISDNYGTEFTIVDEVISDFISLEQNINGKRFNYHVFCRVDNKNLYIPYQFSSVEYARLREIVNRCLDMANVVTRGFGRNNM